MPALFFAHNPPHDHSLRHPQLRHGQKKPVPAWCSASSRLYFMTSKSSVFQPSSIKRPVVEWGARITVGFDAASWAAALEGVAGYH